MASIRSCYKAGSLIGWVVPKLWGTVTGQTGCFVASCQWIKGACNVCSGDVYSKIDIMSRLDVATRIVCDLDVPLWHCNSLNANLIAINAFVVIKGIFVDSVASNFGQHI